MDKHQAHDIVHTWNGGMSENCPVCNGEMDYDDKALIKSAKDIAATNFKPRVNPDLPLSQRSPMIYDEENKNKKTVAEVVENKENEKFYTLIDAMLFSEDKRTPPKSFKVLPFGTFKTKYGEMNLTPDIAKDMVKHFNAGLRAGGKDAGLPIDLEHGDTPHRDEAAGWMKKFSIKDDGLYCDETEWTSLGKQKLEDGSYKFISPEIYLKNYTDPETGKSYSNVLTGAGLVNKPTFTHSLNKLVHSENDKNKNLTESENTITIYLEPIKSSERTKNTMDIHEIAKKALNERTSDEQKFLIDHKDELTFAEAKAEGLAQEATKKEETPTGKITMSESDVKKLQEDAAAGKLAADKIKRMELKEEVRKLVFTEKGLKLPTDQINAAVDLLMTMDEKQAEVYKKQLEALPDKEVFSEEGTDKNIETDAANAGLRFNELTRSKMKENKELSYEQASKIVASENPDLTKILYGVEN